MADNTPSILVTGDSRLHVECMAAALGPQQAVITSLADVRLRSGPIDIVVCHTTGFESCLESLQSCRRLLPDAAVIVIGGPFDECQYLQLIELGMVGCVQEDASTGTLLSAIEAGRRREASCSGRIVSIAFARLAHLGKVKQVEDSAALTYRECQVFQLVQQGLSNKEIAQLLSISVSTAKNHVHQVLAKLRIRSRHHAIDWDSRLQIPTKPKQRGSA